MIFRLFSSCVCVDAHNNFSNVNSPLSFFNMVQFHRKEFGNQQLNFNSNKFYKTLKKNECNLVLVDFITFNFVHEFLFYEIDPSRWRIEGYFWQFWNSPSVHCRQTDRREMYLKRGRSHEDTRHQLRTANRFFTYLSSVGPSLIPSIFLLN